MPDPRLDQEHAPEQGRPHLCGSAGPFGLTPAAAFGQKVRGQVRIIVELVTRDTHTEQFPILPAKHIREKYEGISLNLSGDPRGDDRQLN